jgi:hypothetical protein
MNNIKVKSRYATSEALVTNNDAYRSVVTYDECDMKSGHIVCNGGMKKVMYKLAIGEDGLVETRDKFDNIERCKLSDITDNTPGDTIVFLPIGNAVHC